MRTSKTQPLPRQLEGARRRFERWRRTRKIGSRIPDALWAAAVNLAETHGVSPTAAALGVDYYSLKKRLVKKTASRSRMAAPTDGPAFVEVAAPARMAVPECILDLEDVEGTKMRIHFKGVEAPDLAALSRSLWGIE